MSALAVIVDELLPQTGAIVRSVRRYEWDERLRTTVAHGYGYQAVYRDGTRGRIRKHYSEAQHDARSQFSALTREDASHDGETG